jgi:predicted membrane protein
MQAVLTGKILVLPVPLVTTMAGWSKRDFSSFIIPAIKMMMLVKIVVMMLSAWLMIMFTHGLITSPKSHSNISIRPYSTLKLIAFLQINVIDATITTAPIYTMLT